MSVQPKDGVMLPAHGGARERTRIAPGGVVSTRGELPETSMGRSCGLLAKASDTDM